MKASKNSIAKVSRIGMLARASSFLLLFTIFALGATSLTAPVSPSSADADGAAFKYDGPGDAPCLHDPGRICPSTATLIAEGRPVDVPTLPLPGLIILGLLIAATTYYTLNKQQKQQGKGRGNSGDGSGKPRQATS